MKRNVLIGSFVASLILFVLFFVAGSQFCYQSAFCTSFFIRFHPFVIADFLFIAPVILIFSVFTYFLREEIFRSWVLFAKWWVPLSIVLTLITPETTGSSFVPFFGRGHVALAMSGLFFIISLLIIAWKYVATRRSKT